MKKKKKVEKCKMIEIIENNPCHHHFKQKYSPILLQQNKTNII